MLQSKEDGSQEQIQPSWNIIYPNKEAAAQARLLFVQNKVAKGEDPTWALEEYMNNFRMRLPCYDEDKPGMNNYRRILNELGLFDVPFKQRYEQGTKRALFLASPTFLKQTPRQFFAAIDQALIEEGIDLNRVRELSEAQAKLEICQLTTQAFDRLRTVYSHHDLTT